MKNAFFKNILFFAIFLTTLTLAFAENDIMYRYGIYAGLNYNMHSAEFKTLPGIPNCCPRFENGDGTGINIDILYEKNLEENIRYGLRVGIMNLDAILKSTQSTTIITTTGPADGLFEYKIDSKFFNIGIEPRISYYFEGLFAVDAGIRIGYNLKSTFDQVETLVQPTGVGTFLDSLGNDTHSRTRNKFSGDVPQASPFQLGLTGGISREFPLNASKTFVAAPEISYYLPFTKLAENTDWKAAALKIGVALKYGKRKPVIKLEKFNRENQIDTIKIQNENIAVNNLIPGKEKISSNTVETETEIITTEVLSRTDTLFFPKKYILTGEITLVGLDNSGNEIPNPEIKVEEFISNRLNPILNYVFFDENSYDLNKKYKKINKTETAAFEINSLFQDNTLDIYYNLLNVIGKRMNENSNAKIKLVGCNADINDEKSNTDLSTKRAETVKRYFTDVWNISPDRIKIESRNLPEKASKPKDDADKIQENRRVEIYADNDKILEPIFIEKIDRTTNPPVIRFKLSSNVEAGIKNRTISAYQGSDKNAGFVNTGTGSLPNYLDWVTGDSQKSIPKLSSPLVYSLEINDNKGQNLVVEHKSSPLKVITVQNKRSEKIGDNEIEKFSLILFDFDKSNIEGANKKIVDFISNRIKSESEIEILGYTDRTGEADYNKKLSEKRVQAAAKALKRNDATTIAVGEDKLIYDNETPEGRFYCRTVDIIVKTKVK